MGVITKDKRTRASPTINKLITHFEMSNLADGKSVSTIIWYRDILKLFLRYLKENMHSNSIGEFNIENARNYVFYLRSRNKFGRYTNTHVQHSGLSPQTVRGHIRGLKAFSSWLYREQYTTENRLRNLKIPKAPVKLIEPLTDQEISQIISSINQSSPAGVRNHAIFVTALDNGLRASGLADIKLGQRYATALLLLGLLAAIAAHGIFNFVLFTQSWFALLVFPIVAGLSIVLTLMLRHSRRTSTFRGKVAELQLTCPDCDGNVPFYARFCTHCGVKILGAVRKGRVACGNCGVVVEHAASYCNACGNRLVRKPFSSK